MNKIIVLLSILLLEIVLYNCSCKQPKPVNAPLKEVTDENLVRKGEYLITIAGCNDCHSPKILGPQGPEIDSSLMLSGYPSSRPMPEWPMEVIAKGQVVVNFDLTAAMGLWGMSFAPNITSDQTGIGSWTEQQFTNALIHGKLKGLDGARTLLPPMPWQNFKNMKQEDVKAIFVYLKSIKPVRNVAPASKTMSALKSIINQ
jgi:hypothetical protein